MVSNRNGLWKANNVQPVQQQDHGIDRVQLMPPDTEIDGAWSFMMIVVIRFAQHQQVDAHEVAARIFQAEIPIPELVRVPINDSAVKCPHGDDDRQQKILPGRGREENENSSIQADP